MVGGWRSCREDADRSVAAETLGLILNPLTREIRPMRLMLAACS
jgi:hypothetical protein